MSTGVRTSGVGDGVGEADGARVTRGVGVGEGVALGAGVTTTVGMVERSGGGSTNASIREVSRSKRSPMPSMFARTTVKPVANRNANVRRAIGQRRRARRGEMEFMVRGGE